MTPQKQFAAKVKALIAQARELRPETRRAVIDLLNEARKNIVAQLVDVDRASFSAYQLRTLKISVDQAMDQFQRQASSAVSSLQVRAARIGAETAAAPVSAAGVASAAALGGVDANVLAIAQGYTADLLTGLSKDAAAKINGIIQRAFLGGQSVTDIIAQIGRAIPDADFTGVFGPIGQRATTIAITEILRVHSIAQQAQLEDLQARHPELKKQWVHLAAAVHPRPSHVFADGQIRGVDETFEVGGEPLMYPRDPNGSPENTINCHCLMTPYFSEEDLQPSASQKALLDKLGIGVSVEPAA